MAMDAGDKPFEPVVAQKKPCFVTLKKGRRYLWCSCGLSKKQPFCDGAHKGTGMEPLMFKAEKDEDVVLCACKQTKAGPYCDGSHNNLDDTYVEASDEEVASMADSVEIERDGGDHGKALLDGGAYVLTSHPAVGERRDTLLVQSQISSVDGAEHLSAVRFVADEGVSPWQKRMVSDTVLFVVEGKGSINIEGKSFAVGPEVGVYVKAGEAFRFEAEMKMIALAAVCPEADKVDWPEAASGSFDEAHSERRVGVDPDKAQVMANRFFQILVDSEVGSTEVTQFIGEIPRSRAAMHRHLYEEAIVILSGEGTMWTGTKKAPVQPGDIIFLPHQQGHSIECTSDSGMRLMGVFYPAGSPAINY